MADEYECEMCGATFDNQDDLEIHAQEEHGKGE